MSKRKPYQIDVREIKDPTFLKGLSYADLNDLCVCIRAELISEISRYGGHLSPNLGDVEAIVALHRVFDFRHDKLIFDVGHQCYAHKILTGRSLDHIGHEGGVSGFQSRNESPYDPYDAGHSSTAISAAEAFAISRDQMNENYDVVAFVGDSSIVNGLSMEGLNHLASAHTKVIIVLNDNGMSISKPVGGLNAFFRKIATGKTYNRLKASYNKQYALGKMAKGFYSFSFAAKQWFKRHLIRTNLFDDLGFSYIGAVDGNNVKAVEKALKQAKNTTKSVVVHIVTQKGKGYPLAEKDSDGSWHYAAPFHIESGEPLSKRGPTFTSEFASLVHETLQENPETVLITPATLKGSELESSFRDFPSRCYDVGIAEEHALTFAGAMAINEKHPIVSIYSTFLQRAYDELSHDVARMKVGITLLIDRSGFAGSNGETHQGLYDVAYLRSIPNVIVTMPSTAKQAKELLAMSLKSESPFAIRYGREALLNDASEPVEFGHFSRGEKKNECAFLAVGPKGRELSKKLSDLPIDYIDAIFLIGFEESEIEALSRYERIFVYDPYGTEQGFASSLSLALLKNGFKGALEVYSVPNQFVPYGSIENQERRCGVDLESVERSIRSRFER